MDPEQDTSTRALRQALHALAPTGSPSSQGASYLGSPHPLLGVTTPDLRRLARGWVAADKRRTPEAILATADALFASPLHDEKTLAALILGYSKPARRAATPARVGAWLGQLAGWAEVDALCSNVFQAEDLLDDWAAWGPWLRGLTGDADINKRRAALVLLTGPVRRSADPRLLDAALHALGRLQAERAPLITKAVSWLLRTLTLQHREVVAGYLDEHRTALPAIALREAANKLATGRKSG